MVIEISFPRGGRKPFKSDQPIRLKKDYDLFGRSNKHNEIKKKPFTANAVQDKYEPLGKDIEAASAELLNYRSVRDGMVLLGSIREVQKMAIGINLPGRLSGRVMVTQISIPYTELLHKIVDDKEPEGYKSLRQIFTLGQCVPVKVLNVDEADEKYRLSLSMIPQDVNAQLSHSSIQTGMLLWGAISSVEEHGYVVDLGITNCRAFLKKTNMDEDKTYVQGEVAWFIVQKRDSSSNATTVTLNSKSEKLETMKIIDDINLDHLLPGMKIDFTISKHLNNGLEGKFLNDYTGYVHISQFKDQYGKLKNYSVEQNIEARVLYVMPITKLAYLTFRGIETHQRGNIQDGTLTTCTVLHITKGGLYVLLGKSNNLKGFVSFRRLKNRLPIYGEMNEFEVIRDNYPNRSKHKCRVLNYDYFEQIYICSLEKELTEDIIFSLKNAKVGQEVSATIKEVQPAGLLVQVDNIQCYIKNIHLSDVVLDSYANIKSKYKAGQTIKAKVFMVNLTKNNCHLTIKPSLMNAETVLASYDQAQFNKQFLGVVKQITTNGLLIEFFGNVFGWVPKNEMSFEQVDRPEQMFKIGQVVKCTVISVNIELQRLSLSLQPPKITSKKKLLTLGQHVNAVITNIIDAGIEVNVTDFNIPGMIPLMHITKFPNLAHLLAGTYKTGDNLTNLVCVQTGARIPILSMRDTHLYDDNIPDIETLQINTILPCSVQSINAKVMFLRTAIKNWNRYVAVLVTNISNIGNVQNTDLKSNQYVLAKVLNKSIDKKTQMYNVEATTKLNECWNYDLNESVQRVAEYLEEIDRIRNHLELLKKPLGSLMLGQIVTGVVQEKTDAGSYIVELKNGAKAIVQPEHVKQKLIVGKDVKGIVLWTDFINDVAEISLCAKLMTRINNTQNGNISTTIGMDEKHAIHAEVLLAKEDFALVVLRGQHGNRQIAFLPARLHANDFFPDLRAYKIGSYIKIAIIKKANGKIFGLPKQLIKDTNKNIEKLLTPMIQLPESIMNKTLANIQEINNTETEEVNNPQQNKKTKKRKNAEPSIGETTNQTESKKKKQKVNQKEEEETNGIQTQKEIPTKQVVSKKKRKENQEQINANEDIKTETKKEKNNKKLNQEHQTNDEANLTEQVDSKKKKKEKKQKANGNEDIKTETKKDKNNKKLNQEQQINSEANLTEQVDTKKKKKEKEQKINQELTNKIDKKRKTEAEENKNELVKKQKLNETSENINPILSGVSNFWNVPSSQNVAEESSGDEDTEQSLITKQQKKKKMTPAERAEAARLEEERIRKIETELADSEAAPKTADQFDRLLLANPNNSLLWINYMAFHLEATEIEKARATARKALNTIEFREEQEKLNVWIAFLNLENRYGTNDSFTTLLEEAVQMNDALSVYLQALNILSDSKKTTEFTELLTNITKKFKQEFKMWTGAADACYKCELKEQARNLMQRALKSLDEKQHVNILVQFAFMESRYNEPERAEAILEKVLASYPRRVDVWTSYVDMLIKSDRIHIARNVLERAAAQKLPARKMKTIFTKYIQFETKYGDEDKVTKVREIAAHYVKTALK